MASLCRQPFAELHIRMDGSVYACMGGQFIGNLRENSANELWNSKKILELRRQLTENEFDHICLNCSLYDNRNLHSKIKDSLGHFNPAEIKKIGENFYFQDQKIPQINCAYGFIDYFKRGRDKSIIEGWAMNRFENRPAGYVVILVNGKFLAHAKINIERPDVSEALGDKNIFICGFKAETSFVSVENKISVVVFSEENELLGEIRL